MLGKGLESLIPNKKGDSAGTNSTTGASDTPVSSGIPKPADVDFVFLHADASAPTKVSDVSAPHASQSDDSSHVLVSQPDPDEDLIEPYSVSQEKYEPILASSPAGVSIPVHVELTSDHGGAPESSQAAHSFDPVRPASSKKNKDVVKPEAKFPDAIFHIETSKIVANPLQPRRYFDEEAINELAASIREFGILQPLVVTKLVKESDGGADVEYQLIAGERRLLASRKLGLQTVPAIIKNVDIERERLELAIIENLQRENLSSIEMARAFSRLQDEFRLTQREIAARLGKSRETVANTMRLLDLPPAVQQAIEEGKISESHGRLLLGVGDVGAQDKLFHDLIGKKMTTRELKSRLKNIDSEQKRGNPHVAQIKFVEEKLSADLGAPVRISASGDSGKIVINYYSKEELDQIVQKLNLHT